MSPPLPLDHAFRADRGVPVSGPVLSSKYPGIGRALRVRAGVAGQELADWLSFHGRNSHWNDGCRRTQRQSHLLELTLDWLELIGLNVEEHQVGPGRPAGQPELAQQIVLYQEQRAQEKGS